MEVLLFLIAMILLAILISIHFVSIKEKSAAGWYFVTFHHRKKWWIDGVWHCQVYNKQPNLLDINHILEYIHSTDDFKNVVLTSITKIDASS